MTIYLLLIIIISSGNITLSPKNKGPRLNSNSIPLYLIERELFGLQT